MLRKLTAERFLKPQNRPAVPKIEHKVDVVLRNLQGRDRQILPKYSALLKNLHAFTFPKNVELIKKARSDLKNNNIQASLDKFSTAVGCFSRSRYGSFAQLYSEHPASSWEHLDGLMAEISALPAQEAAKFNGRLLNLFTAPRVVQLKVNNNASDAVEYIHALGRSARTSMEFEAVNLALNQYLLLKGVTLESFTSVLTGLDPRVKPRFDSQVASRIHLENKRSELVTLFDVFREHNVALNTRQMSTYLRALYTNTDAGSICIIGAIRECEFPVGFYHFLVRVLCLRKDTDTVNWLFSNRIMPLMESKPELIPFLLHTLLIRTLELDGLDESKGVLAAMGAEVLEPSWKALFVKFRRLGEVGRAFDCIKKAVTTFDLKLSLSFVNDYLLLVSQHHKPSVYFSTLVTAFPEHVSTLEELGLLNSTVEAVGIAPPFLLVPAHRNFEPTAIDESTLMTAYEVALNELYSIDEIMNMYNVYESYVINLKSRVTMAVVDKFVCKLVSLDQAEGVDAAELVYRSALSRLKLRQSHDGRFRCTSLYELVPRLVNSGEIQRAIKLTTLTCQTQNMAVRGKALRKLYQAIDNRNPDHASTFADWAHSEGLLLVPFKASEEAIEDPNNEQEGAHA